MARGITKEVGARKKRAFDLVLPVQYRLSCGREGAGETVRIGLDSLLLSCQEPLPLAEVILINIAWPVLASGSDPVVLRINGVIERREANRYEISIGRHFFIRQAKSNERPAR